jgi:CDP-diacylglycerol---glycerol-3-phosphate 3-phosphatidyltransferase
LSDITTKKPETFTDWIRLKFKKILETIGGFFNHLGIHPNLITIISLIGNIIGAVFVAFGHLTIGGLVILVTAPLDAIDGTMARLRGEVTKWGAFVDSVSDRYSELIILGALVIHFWQKGDFLSIAITYLAACAAVLVSYVKARAEALGYEAKIGFLSRLERYIILIPSIIFNFPQSAIWILAIFGNFTALQRIYHVRKQVFDEIKLKKENKS